MEELIKRLERVIATGVPDKDGQHPISAETVLEVVKGLSEHGTNLAEVGTDCISRQAAIETVQNRHMMLSKEKVLLINDLEKLPPAEPKRGKWLDADICGELPVIVCDQCNTFYPLSFGEFHNFCPNCGAKMEGASE